MADDDSTSWAPQSPDLSGLNAFAPEPLTQLQAPPPPSQNPYAEQQQHHPLSYGAQSGKNKNGYLGGKSRSAQMKSEDSPDDGDGEYHPNPSATPTGRRGRRAKAGVKQEEPKFEDEGPGPSLGIEIKTKFPVARIKRIMQADEDVGKVAQVTPVAVCKYHHGFMTP
jgi:hypothetical protein